MVDRDDAWGQSLPLDERSAGKARTVKGHLPAELLARHSRGADVADLIGPHTTAADDHSRWLAIDIDLHGDPDPARKRGNRRAAKSSTERPKG